MSEQDVALFRAVTADDLNAAVAALLAGGASSMRTRFKRLSNDGAFVHDALGEALFYYSSPALITMLLRAGANPRAAMQSLDGADVLRREETPLQFVRRAKEQAASQGIEVFGRAWKAECGRAPTAQWFGAVEAVLQAYAG